MRTLLHVVALIFGIAMVYRGVTEGLPAPPLDGRAWGQLFAFGFGVLMALVGGLYLWRLLAGNDGTSTGNSALVLVLLAAVVTAGAVMLKGGNAGSECERMVRHLRVLATQNDTTGASLARFEASRAELEQGCPQMTGAARRCILRARTLDDLNGCP